MFLYSIRLFFCSVVMVLVIASKVFAGTCTEISSGHWSCSGPENTSFPYDGNIFQNITSPISVSMDATYGGYYDGYGISLYADGGISITQAPGGRDLVVRDYHPVLFLRNSISGSVVINLSGSVIVGNQELGDPAIEIATGAGTDSVDVKVQGDILGGYGEGGGLIIDHIGFGSINVDVGGKISGGEQSALGIFYSGLAGEINALIAGDVSGGGPWRGSAAVTIENQDGSGDTNLSIGGSVYSNNRGTGILIDAGSSSGSGNINISVEGNIHASDTGIEILKGGGGDTDVNIKGGFLPGTAYDIPGTPFIDVVDRAISIEHQDGSNSGNISVTVGADIQFSSEGIVIETEAQNSDVTILTKGRIEGGGEAISVLSAENTGNIFITTEDAIKASDGIIIESQGSGSIDVTTKGSITADSRGILIYGGEDITGINLVTEAPISSEEGSILIYAQATSAPVNITVNGNVTSEYESAITVEGDGSPVLLDIGASVSAISSNTSVDASYSLGKVTLRLRDNWAFNRSVLGGRSANDVIELSGSMDSSLDVSRIGNNGHNAPILSFEHFVKSGSSTWNLTGTQALGTFSSGTIMQGNLVLNDSTLLFSSMGTGLHVQSGGILSGTGVSTIDGHLINDGLISLSDGNTNTDFIIRGNYTGNGGNIAIDTVLGDDSSQTDRLIIQEDTSGNSFVKVYNQGGLGVQTTGDGIQIIQVHGVSDPNAFTLRGDYTTTSGQPAVVAGVYAYTLWHNGQTNTDGNWYLRSEMLPPGPGPGPGPVPPGPGPGPGPTPNPGGGGNVVLYQPLAPVLEAYPQALLSYMDMETLQQRTGNRQWGECETDTSSLFWARAKANRAHIEPDRSTTGTNRSSTLWSLRSGFDAQLFSDGGHNLLAGVNVEYGQIKTDIKSIYGNGSIDTTGYGLGANLTWFGPAGFYMDGQARAIWFDSDLSSRFIGSLTTDNDGFGYGFSLEGGKKFDFSQNWSLTPQLQLSYTNVDFDSFVDRYSVRASLKYADKLTGRLGLSVDYRNSWQNASGTVDRFHLYGIINLHYDFKSGSKVRIENVVFTSEDQDLWGSLGLGGIYSWSNDRYAVYGEGSAKTSLQDFSDSYELAGQIGFRVKW